MPDLQRAVLELVRGAEYKPVKPKLLAKALSLDQEGTRELKRIIKKLVKQGRIAYGPNHLILPTRPDGAKAAKKATAAERTNTRAASDHITGVFRRTAAGHGFVRPSATPREVGRKEDIYISAKNASDASSGDIVMIRLLRSKRPGGRLEGQVVEVVERETNRFVGLYYEQGGLGLVDVDGSVFSQPILVGDPGAKGAQAEDKVVIEMVRFPSHTHDGEGVVLEVLGPRGAPGVDTLSIIHEFNLPGEFAEDAMETAREQAGLFDESIGLARVDLSAETIITIDPADARDFDDAISLQRTEAGHWLLGVHIADVSHFVQPKTPLDREARDRATSVYLPDRVIPMIPETISNNLASLQPDRVRYTVSAMIEMTGEGVLVGCEVFKAAIQSRRRFTYEEVDQFLADRSKWKKKLSPEVHALLGRMHELAMLLRQRRFQRGALELTMPEVKIDLDKQGRVAGAHLVENTESHQIIEEFMLAANEAVADKLRTAGLLFMRRIHEAPDPRKLQALTEFARDLGFKVESLESRFELQKLLDQVKGQPAQHAVNYAVLRSMQKAIYSPAEEGHYALASDCYCHFTSPIRRYPDLTVHRLLEQLMLGRKPRQNVGELAAQAEHCSQREQRATEAERELTKVKLLDYFSHRLGEELDAIITGVEEFGLFVQGIQIPAEGLIHISALADDYYHFDRTTHSLTGHRAGNRFRLGDPVRVSVARVDVDRRQLDFRLVERLAKLPKRASGKQPAPSGGKRPAARSKPARGKQAQAAAKPKAKRKRRK